jgi:hypothetical protein
MNGNRMGAAEFADIGIAATAERGAELSSFRGKSGAAQSHEVQWMHCTPNVVRHTLYMNQHDMAILVRGTPIFGFNTKGHPDTSAQAYSFFLSS